MGHAAFLSTHKMKLAGCLPSFCTVDQIKFLFGWAIDAGLKSDLHFLLTGNYPSESFLENRTVSLQCVHMYVLYINTYVHMLWSGQVHELFHLDGQAPGGENQDQGKGG